MIRSSVVLGLCLVASSYELAATVHSRVTAQGQVLFGQLSPRNLSFPSSGCWRTRACQFFVYELNAPDSAAHGLTMAILRVSQPARLRVIDIRKSDSKRDLFAQSAARDTLGVVNGGFFGFDGRGRYVSLGLLIENGRTLRPLHPWTTGGVLVQTPDGPLIHRIREFSRAASYTQALQSKPLLVENGAVAINSDDGERFDRSAVGILKDGAIVFSGVFTESGRSISLRQFAQLLVDWASTRNDHWDSVLAMDGGPSSHLFVPSLGSHHGADVAQFIPNAVAVEVP